MGARPANLHLACLEEGQGRLNLFHPSLFDLA